MTRLRPSRPIPVYREVIEYEGGPTVIHYAFAPSAFELPENQGDQRPHAWILVPLGFDTKSEDPLEALEQYPMVVARPH